MVQALTHSPLLRRTPDKLRVVHQTQDVLIAVPAIAVDKPMPATLFKPNDWTGATVLLVCGAGDNRFSFKWVLFEKFLSKGIAVLTVDPPGHGDYMTVPSTVGNARAAMRAASDWLHGQAGVRKVGVIGISFGGCQVADLAANDERIVALASIASPVALPSITRSVIVGEALKLIFPLNLALLLSISPRDVWSEWKSIRGAWYGESLYDMIEMFKMDECVRKMGTRPTMFVHGTQDMAVPPSNARRLHDAAKAERKLLFIPQATHLTAILRTAPMQQVADWFAAKLAEPNGDR